MKTSEEIDEIAPALAQAQADFKRVQKSGDNKFDRYRYAMLEDFVSAIDDKLAKVDCAIITSVGKVMQMPNRTTQKGGTEYVVRVLLTTRIIHSSGQWIECVGYGEGQDRADKALYKAITGGRKYLLGAMLGLATTDDPEVDDDHNPAPAQGQSKKKQNQSQQQQSVGESGALFTISDVVTVKEGTSGKGPWTLSKIHFGGMEATTFKDEIVKVSQAAIKDKVQCHVEYFENNRGQLEIKDIYYPQDDAPKAESAPTGDAPKQSDDPLDAAEGVSVITIQSMTDRSVDMDGKPTTVYGLNTSIGRCGCINEDAAGVLANAFNGNVEVSVNWKQTPKGRLITTASEIPF
ncbi:MAG: ERF family protein [Phycisphaeraceae bacterium]|nr:ERF family protein [Phycisphaeraceae bacterium]